MKNDHMDNVNINDILVDFSSASSFNDRSSENFEDDDHSENSFYNLEEKSDKSPILMNKA